MPSVNSYDVTTWPVGNAAEDIGEVINSIIADIKARQTATDENHGGKPGAVIHVPPGDYHLRTRVVIDISFLRIEGSGHGFSSSSIRFNVPEDEWPDLHELWPGAAASSWTFPSRERRETESKGAAFSIERSGSPRISSVEFANFCIDGMHFDRDGSELHPENTYVNGKTGIYVGSANDSFRITGMGFVLPRARAHDLQRRRALRPRQLHRRMRELHRAARVGTGVEDHRQPDRSRLQGTLDLCREPRRAADHRQQRIPPWREQCPSQRRHAFEYHQQPSALVLPGHGGPRGEQLGEPRGHEPLPARPRAVDAVPGRREWTGRPLRTPPHRRQQQFRHRQPLLRGGRRGDASVRPARPPCIIRLWREAATTSPTTTSSRWTCMPRRATPASRRRWTRC